MDRFTEIYFNIQGNFSGNRVDNRVDNTVHNKVHNTVHNKIDNSDFGALVHHGYIDPRFINQGGALRARDREPKETSRPYWIVPYSRNRTFTGRNGIIESVKGYCKSKDHNRVALQGLEGTGKTQIALEYVYWRAQESGCHVFWTHGSGMLKFSQDFRTIGQRVHIPQASPQKDEEQFLLGVKAWFEGPDSGDWILVIDNADNDDDFLSNNSPIAKLVPQGNKGTVIFTTRSLKVARRQECTIMAVEKMAGEEALELFSKRFRNWDSLEDEEQKIVPMILESLGYLPLAVVGAAAFMTETTTRPSEYWSIFQMGDTGRKKLLSREFSDIRREADVTESILSTYFITFEQITKQMPTAARLLRLIAFLNRQNIPEELLSQCGLEGIDGSIEFRGAIGNLLGFSLVTDVKCEGKRFYELHRLVQLSIRAYLSPEELGHWKVTALRVVSRLFPQDEIEWRYGGIAAAYVPHALAVAKESTGSIAEDLVFSMGRYFSYIGFYSEAETMFQHALEGKEKVLGPDHIDTLRSFNNLALVLSDLGRHGESETMFRRALEGKEKVLGPDHIDTLGSVNNLAIVLRELGRYGESETMFRRALKGKEKVLGPDHIDTLGSVNNLALVLRDLGRHGESETMSLRALEGKEKVLGPGHPSTLTSVYTLAAVLEDQEKYDESEKMWRRVLEARGDALGPEHIEVYETLERLAGLYEKQRIYSQAEEAYERACTGFSKTLGEPHPTTLECIKRLTELRETKSAAERTSAIDAAVAVIDDNNRRSLHDRLRKLMGLRGRKGLGDGKSGKRL